MQVYIYENNKPYVYYESNNIETVAGVLAALTSIIISKNLALKYGANVDISEFIVLRGMENVSNETLTCNRLDINPPPESHTRYLWVREMYRYTLYKFSTGDFMQGFISTCQNFNVDFRSYIKGPIFEFNAGKVIYLTLKNYVMTNSQVFVAGPEELDDVEEEEKDDENILEPLERDDYVQMYQ